MKNRKSRINTRTIIGMVMLFSGGSAAVAATGNPKHFVEPGAVPSFGLNNYIATFDEMSEENYGITDFGTPDVLGYADLWNVGDAYTTRQEFTDLYQQRINAYTANTDLDTGFIHDAGATLSTPTITAHAPGYITGSGNFYSFSGDYGAHVNVSNYGGTDNSIEGGTLLILQTSAGLNPDFRPLYNVGADVAHPDITPGALTITKHDGSPLPAEAEILTFDILFQAGGVQSSFGPVPWQELIWVIWVPAYTGDLKIDFEIPVHAAFSSLRVDTAIGTINEEQDLESFAVLTATPACAADFNADDVRDVADLFAYINAWLAKTEDANFNGDAAVDVADLFAYINAWLAGC